MTMAKATNKTYEALVGLYVNRDIKVSIRDKALLNSLSIDFEQFKNYVEACKIADQRRKKGWKKFFDDSGLGYQNYREEMKGIEGKQIAEKMLESSTMSSFAPRVAKMPVVTRDDLEKLLPDYVSGGDITKLFRG